MGPQVRPVNGHVTRAPVAVRADRAGTVSGARTVRERRGWCWGKCRERQHKTIAGIFSCCSLSGVCTVPGCGIFWLPQLCWDISLLSVANVKNTRLLGMVTN